MEVICLETEAFYSLVEKVVDQSRAKDNQANSKWIRYEEAMELLGIKYEKELDQKLMRMKQSKGIDQKSIGQGLGL